MQPENRQPVFANNEGKRFLKIIGIPIIILIVLAKACSDISEQPASEEAQSSYTTAKESVLEPVIEKPQIEISAVALNAAYQENEVAADQKFKGRNLVVEGRVTRIAKDAFNNPYITLESGQYFQDLHCSIPETDAAKLKKGQTVVVTCRSNGLLMGAVQLELIEPKK